MTRLFSILSAFVLVTALLCGPTAGTAYAAGQTAPVDAKAIVGMPVGSLVAAYGNPSRTEPSEYGFTWHIYSRDYHNYFMAGVRDQQVVAVYATAETLCYGGDFALNSTRDAVRAVLGAPVSYVRSGNSIALLSDTDQRDMFAVGGNYVLVFYDVLKGTKVTSVMVVPQDDMVRTFVDKQPLTPELTDAYARISIDLVNAARARNGLKTLSSDALSNRLAISRSNDMVARDYFSHYTPENKSPMDLAQEMGFRYTSFGENIAYGNNNAMLAHESFMNSAGHRSNVLKSAYTKIGAGAVYGGSRYVILTNIFSNNTADAPAEPEPTAAPPEPAEPGQALINDVNGDGQVTITDYTLVRLDILGIKALDGNAKAAADANADGQVTITDYTLIRLVILGLR